MKSKDAIIVFNLDTYMTSLNKGWLITITRTIETTCSAKADELNNWQVNIPFYLLLKSLLCFPNL